MKQYMVYAAGHGMPGHIGVYNNRRQAIRLASELARKTWGKYYEMMHFDQFGYIKAYTNTGPMAGIISVSIY